MAGDADPAPSRMPHDRSGLRRVLIAIGLGIGATAGALLIAGTARADDSGVRERPALTRLTHTADRLLRPTTGTQPVRTTRHPVTRPPAPTARTGRAGGAVPASRATRPHSTRTSAATPRRHPATRPPVIATHHDTADRPTRVPGRATVSRPPATKPGTTERVAVPVERVLAPVTAALADATGPVLTPSGARPLRAILRGTTATLTHVAGALPQLPPVAGLPTPPDLTVLPQRPTPAEAPALGRPATGGDPAAETPATEVTASPDRTTTAVTATGRAEPSGPVASIPAGAADPASSGTHRGTAPALPHRPLPGSLPASPAIPATSAGPAPGGGHGPAVTALAAPATELASLPTLPVRPVRAPRGSTNAPDTRPG
jgi:hypothetical protein